MRVYARCPRIWTLTNAVDGITGTAQSGCMTGDRIPSLIMQIVDELRAHGIVITRRADEWRVNFRGDTDATAYVTDDLHDAFDAFSCATSTDTRLIVARRFGVGSADGELG